MFLRKILKKSIFLNSVNCFFQKSNKEEELLNLCEILIYVAFLYELEDNLFSKKIVNLGVNMLPSPRLSSSIVDPHNTLLSTVHLTLRNHVSICNLFFVFTCRRRKSFWSPPRFEPFPKPHSFKGGSPPTCHILSSRNFTLM